MSKKFIIKSFIIALVIAFALPLIVLGVNPLKLAKADDVVTAEKYFYNQLTNDTQREFYHEMEEMAEIDENGESVFIRGGDMIVDGVLTQEQLADFATGKSNQLLNDFGAAKDAFYFDHAELFYVDFSYLSFTVSLRNGEYFCYLGTGRAETYYTQGINSKADLLVYINEYNTALDKLVEDARKETNIAEQVRYVHNKISEKAVYKLENTAKPKNIGFIRTAFGALVKGECCCEGYARAFKNALDKLGIPCVLVQGAYRHSSTAVELHMWNYVYIDNVWLGVDVTFDDLDKSINGTEISYNYFLKGATIMDRQHAPSAIVSKSNFEFAYPELSELNFGETFSKSSELFKISQSKGEPLNHPIYENGHISGYEPVLDENGEQAYATDISVSFYLDGEWCNYTKLKNKGYYLLMKQYFISTDDEKEDLHSTRWSYLDPEMYYLPETEDSLQLEGNATTTYFEFAVTDVPARDPDTIKGDRLTNPNFDDLMLEVTTYCGDPTKLYAESGLIKAEYGDPYYVAQPYIKKSSPVQTGSLTTGKTYHVEVYYDDNLKLKDTNLPYGVSLVGETPYNEVLRNLADYVTIENVKWDPKVDASKVEFDFTPSEMFAHDSILYLFSMKNLVGEKSGKTPNELIYYITHGCVAHAYAAQGYDWNLFAKPQLLENADLSMQNWETSDGEEVSDLLRHRLALVVTNTTYEQEEEMEKLISGVSGGKEIKESQTYNISLTVCKAQVVRTGDKVRISLGFPEGYGPNDAGVTFKAYHFMRDEQNHVTGVEEIDCIITEYGLIITCNAFSPFAIVAVEADQETPVNAMKQVILSNNYGGTVTGDVQGSIISLDKDLLTEEDEEETVTIEAATGYIIESITLDGTVVEFSDNKTAYVTLKYDEISNLQTILDVKFITEVAAEKQEEIIHSTLKAAKIEVASEITIDVGQKLNIVANVEEFGDVNTYFWYKDGQQVPNQHGKTLTIDYANQEDAGSYRLVVVSSSNNQSISTESSIINVIVNGKDDTNDKDLDKEVLILAISIPAIAVVAFILLLAIILMKKKKQQ